MAGITGAGARICCRLALLAALGGCGAEWDAGAERWPEDRPAERSPSERVAYRDRRDLALGTPSIGLADSVRLHDLRAALALLRGWNPGQVVVVAFRGGSDEWRRRTVRAAGYWTSRVNLRFDFGAGRSGEFYTWSETDTVYGAHIRVRFDTGASWSEVGTDAIDPAIAPPGAPSMTLPAIDPADAAGWDAAVRHLFGHAIGLVGEPLSVAAARAQYPREDASARERQAATLERLRWLLDGLRLDRGARERVETALDSTRAAQELNNQRVLERVGRGRGYLTPVSAQ